MTAAHQKQSAIILMFMFSKFQALDSFVAGAAASARSTRHCRARAQPLETGAPDKSFQLAEGAASTAVKSQQDCNLLETERSPRFL